MTLLFFSFIILNACSTANKDESDKDQLLTKESEAVTIEKESTENLSAFTNIYTNKDLGFSIKYPTTWSLRDYKEWTGTEIMNGTVDKEVETIEGAIDLSFANTQEKFDNIFEMPIDYRAVGIRIYKIESKKYNNAYKEEFLSSLDSNERLKNAEVTKYSVNGKNLILYVNETAEALDGYSVLMANAFYKGENYAYSFDINQENNQDKEETRRIIEEYLKPMLSSFEDLEGKINTNTIPVLSDIKTPDLETSFDNTPKLSALDTGSDLTFWDGYQWASNNNVSDFNVCQNEFGTGFSENGCNQYIKDNFTGYNTFNDYDCTEDCSGHEAGYQWAEENDIQDIYDCEGDSDSFIEGCEAYVNENY